jgi:nicotinate-nucleotide pyrophosphorylase
MSAKYDIEAFVDQVISTMQDDLPGKVTEINTEKGDELLINIPNESYYGNIMLQVLNVNQFIYYQVVDIETNTNGGLTAIAVTLQVSVVFIDSSDVNTTKKALRYSRALREVIQENFKISGSASRLKITEFAPQDIQVNEGSDFKMGGIHITSTITG